MSRLTILVAPLFQSDPRLLSRKLLQIANKRGSLRTGQFLGPSSSLLIVGVLLEEVDDNRDEGNHEGDLWVKIQEGGVNWGR